MAAGEMVKHVRGLGAGVGSGVGAGAWAVGQGVGHGGGGGAWAGDKPARGNRLLQIQLSLKFHPAS